MMKLELQYNGQLLTASISDNASVDIFQPNSAIDEVTFDSFRNEFETHIGLKRISQHSLLFIVNDGYRSTPTAQILRWLDRIGSDIIDQASFIIATGTHAPPTQAQLEEIFKELLPRVQSRLIIHDCLDADSLVVIGKDHFDKPVLINKAVLEHDIVIAINSVEPHFFAGYTGGRKSFIPGLADFATIERNHNMANSPEAQPLRLDGNPVAEHLAEMMQLLPSDRCLAIQSLFDRDSRIASIYCGEVSDTFGRAVQDAKQLYSCRVERQYDLIIAEIQSPLDLNLYQAQKAVENVQAAVCDGGRLVILTACKEGIGSKHFFEMASDWDRKTNSPKKGKVAFGSHKLSRVVRYTERIEILIVSELEDDSVRQVFYEPLDKQAFISYLKVKVCEKSNVAVVRDAAHTVLCQ